MALQRRGLRRTPAVLVVTLGSAALLLVLATAMGLQFMQLAEELPKYEGKLRRQIKEVREQSKNSSLAKVAGLWKVVSAAATTPPDGAQPEGDSDAVAVKVVEAGSWTILTTDGLWPLTEPLAAAGLVLVLVIFLLISREDAYDRLLCLIGSGRVLQTTKALRDASHRISRYLLAQFIVNVGCGVCVGIGLVMLQVPYALLWGFFTAVLRYVPMLGPWIAALAPFMLSLMVFEGWWGAAEVGLLFMAVELAANMLAEPYFYGQSIGVSQSALLVAMAFWAWLWGPIGLVLAAPLTVCVVVIAKHVPGLRFFDVLLGDSPALRPSQAFYQRLIARDEVGALEIIQTFVPEGLNPHSYDEIILPALSFVKRDLDAGWLDEAECMQILATLEAVVARHKWAPVDPEATSDSFDTAGRLNILAVPAGDLIDRKSLELTLPLVNPRMFQVQIASEDQLVAEILATVEKERPHLVLIASVPPGGRVSARLLCKRLHRNLPELKIVLAYWLGELEGEFGAAQPLDAGEDVVTASVVETLLQINRFLYLRSLTPSRSA